MFLSFFFAKLLRFSRLIGEDDRSRPGRFCRQEVQPLEADPILEETLSMAYNNRVDQEYQLIQKVLFEEGGDEAGTSGCTNVLPWQLLQLSDCLGKISLDQCRVLPCVDTL